MKGLCENQIHFVIRQHMAKRITLEPYLHQFSKNWDGISRVFFPPRNHGPVENASIWKVTTIGRNPNFSVSHGWRVNNSFLMDGHGDFQPFCTWFWMLGRPAGLPFGAHFQRVYSPPSQSVAGIRVWIRKSRPGTLPETHQHSPWKIGHHPKKKHN